MKHDPLAAKVAARWMRKATDFSSPEALKKYLHDHPGADPKNHHVVKHDDKPSSKDSEPKDHRRTDNQKKADPHGIEKMSEKDLSAFIKKDPLFKGMHEADVEDFQHAIKNDSLRREVKDLIHAFHANKALQKRSPSKKERDDFENDFSARLDKVLEKVNKHRDDNP